MRNPKLFRTAILSITLAGGLVASASTPALPKPAPDADATPWTTGAYVYDGSGNIMSIGSDQFRYDAHGRLTTSTVSGIKQSFTYDRYGNIESIATGTASPISLHPTAATNRLPPIGSGVQVEATYDASGRVTYIRDMPPQTATWNASFTYDALDSVVFSSEPNARIHLYTASDERIATVGTNGAGTAGSDWTLRDPSGKVLRRLKREPTGTWTWVEDYVYMNGRLVASEVAAPERTLHFHQDHLGTPRLITNHMGARVALHTYHAFGRQFPVGNVSPTAADTEPLKFTGHERDSPELDYMHARYYLPSWGRFLSVDPKSRRVALATPQLYNRYSYALNDPLNNVDLDGEDVTPVRVLTSNKKHLSTAPRVVYVDSRLVPRLQKMVAAASKKGISFTFNNLLRTPSEQNGIKTDNTKNNKGTSPHTAGLAIDINVCCMQGTNLDGITAIARDAGLSPLNDQAKDKPHFQANDLITRGDDGKVDDEFKDLVKENQQQVEHYETMREEDPEAFDKNVVTIVPPE
jgi:RHS repeat-associated protein